MTAYEIKEGKYRDDGKKSEKEDKLGEGRRVLL